METDLPTKAVRRFNRGYTRLIGVLEESMHRSDYTLTEARVLWELAHRSGVTASDIGSTLGLDPGYLSRLLKKLERDKLVSRQRSPHDGRQSTLTLTEAGRGEFETLDAASEKQIADLLEPLSADDRACLVAGMRDIERLLLPAAGAQPLCLLRDPRPGELGWIVQKHGELFAREYGWGERLEGLVADIVAAYAASHDPASERVWIAEMDGVPVGSLMMLRKSDEVGQLRLLLLDPRARGMGLGKALVDAALSFARKVGYRKVVLWTECRLDTARAIYQKAGFVRVREEPHDHFGPTVMGEEWEAEL